jgi:hypothetical protein
VSTPGRFAPWESPFPRPARAPTCSPSPHQETK